MRRAASDVGIDPELAAPEAEAVMAPTATTLGFRVSVVRAILAGGLGFHRLRGRWI